jgi:hypothetical protein
MAESFMSGLIPEEESPTVLGQNKKIDSKQEVGDLTDTDFSISKYNNPGNIERGIGWDGEVEGKGYGKNERFAIFKTPEAGLRALKMDLTTKLNRHKGDLRAMIAQYAPSTENDVNQYLKVVQQYAGVKDVYTESDIKNIVKGFIIMENSRELADKYIERLG